MSSTVKILLIVVWALSIIALAVLGIKQATEQAYTENFIEERALPLTTGDTLRILMRADKQFSYNVGQEGGIEIKYTADKKRILYSSHITLNIKPSKDSIGKMVIEKTAEGNNYLDARKRAEAIMFNYTIEDNSMVFDGFFTTDPENKYRNQQMEITVYVPEGTIIFSEENVTSYYGYSTNFADLSNRDNEAHYFKILKNEIECLDCDEKKEMNQEADSLKMIESKNGLDSLKTNENNSWEESLNKGLSE